MNESMVRCEQCGAICNIKDGYCKKHWKKLPVVGKQDDYVIDGIGQAELENFIDKNADRYVEVFKKNNGKKFFLISIVLVIIAIGIFLFISAINNAGIYSIEFTDDFFVPNRIEVSCHFIKKYSVETIDSNSLIYVGENKEQEFDELGKYRFKIYINDSEPSSKFKKEFKPCTVYNLPGNNDFKFIYTNLPETHATEIYIGSNSAFSVDEQNVSGKEKLKTKITIPIIN